MRFFKLLLLAIVLVAIVGGGAMWYMAGSEDGPSITIHSPEKYVGRSTPLAVSIASETELAGTVINLEQNGKVVPLPNLKMETPAAGQVNASATIGRDGLVNGPAMLAVEASRKVLYGLRTVTSRVTRNLEVRLDPPRSRLSRSITSSILAAPSSSC
jgi:hypothetical protein